MKNNLLIIFIINILGYSINIKAQNAVLIKNYSDENSLQLSVSLPQPQMTQKSYDDGITYDNMRVGGCNQYVAGGPDVPAFTTRILVPNGKNPSLFFSSGSSFIRENLLLAPVQNPIPNVENPVIEFVKNLAIYNNDADFPGVFAEISPVYHLRGQAYVYLKVFPYQYNPVQKILSEYSNLTVTISFSGQIESIPEKLQSSTYENMLKSIALNGEEIIQAEKNAEQRSPLDVCTDCYDYLIVTHDDFLTAANTLAVWKNSIGIKTKVVPFSVTGNSNTAIKAYIKNEYLNYGIKYLLLLGDAEFIPTWYISVHPYTDTPQGKTAADIYYVDMDDDYNLLGYMPEADIAYGRLPVNTATEAGRIVQRIIKHENEPQDDEFYKNAAVVSYFENTGMQSCSNDEGPYSIGKCVDVRRFVRTCEEVRDFMLQYNVYNDINRIYNSNSTSTNYQDRPKYWSSLHQYLFGADVINTEIPNELQCSDIYDPSCFQWDGDATSITSTLNSGVSLIIQMDHGDRTGWGHPSFLINNLTSLNLVDYRPVVWSINCMTGWFDNETDEFFGGSYWDDDGFAESWINSDQGGCLGVVAHTRVSWSPFDERFIWGMTDAVWPGFIAYHNGEYPRNSGDNPITCMGDVVNYGKMYETNFLNELVTLPLYWPYDLTSQALLSNIEGGQWFGDPTMKIVPEKCFKNLVLQDVSLNSGDIKEWQSGELITTAGDNFGTNTGFTALSGSETTLNSNRIIFCSGTKFENGSHLLAQINSCTFASDRYYAFNENKAGENTGKIVIGEAPDNQENVSILLYPNPTGGKFTVQILNNKTNSYYLEINNILGKIVFKQDIKTSEIPVDLSAMPKGLYFIKVTGNEETFDKTIVIQ